MKVLRKILRVSLTTKKTNDWVLNKAGIKRELLDTIKARKLAYYGHTKRKPGSCLEKEQCQVHAGEEDHERPDGQYQDVDRTPGGKVNQNDRGQG